MIRLDIPDGTDEGELEAFLASLNEGARDDVRRLIMEGAAEADIAEYITSFGQQLEQEEETIYEEDETGETPPA